MSHSRWVREPLPPHQEDAERWAAFCASVVDQIEAVRAEDAPTVCPTCACSAHQAQRRCWSCQEWKSLVAFPLHRGRARGRANECKACKNEYARTVRQRQKRERFRSILGQAS